MEKIRGWRKGGVTFLNAVAACCLPAAAAPPPLHSRPGSREEPWLSLHASAEKHSAPVYQRGLKILDGKCITCLAIAAPL